MTDRWTTSTRRSQLPPDWPQIRRHVLERDPICTCAGCPRCTTRHGCDRPSTDADHLDRGNDHRLSNLAGKCRDCHAFKSAAEGAAARPRERREPERHPGLL